MIPIISLSDEEKREWLEASDAALSPSAFLGETRRRLLNEGVREMNRVDAGLTAYIDEDGDIAYQITDLAKQYEYYKSSGFPARPGVTPEALAAHLAASALSQKKDRQAIKDVADMFRRALLADHPRLADVPVDIIPASRVNAWARPVPSGGDAIGLNQHFTKCWVWCEWLIWQWVESPDSPFLHMNEPEEKMRSWLDTHGPMLHSMMELASAMMGAHRNSGLLIERHAQELDRNGRNSRGDLYAKMMASIAILHEYGHIALGHTDWLRELVEDSISGRHPRIGQLEFYAQQRRNEYAADQFAARALIAIGAEGGGTTWGLKFRDHAIGWATWMLFTMFHFARPLRVSDDDDPDATHPVPTHRIAAFLGEMGIDELGPYNPPPLARLLLTSKDAIMKTLRFLGVSRVTTKGES